MFMGSSVDAPSSKGPDTDEDESQSKLRDHNEATSQVKLGELLSGRFEDSDIDSVTAVREQREPR